MHKMLGFFVLTSHMVFLKYVFTLFNVENVRSGVVVDTGNVHKIFIILNMLGNNLASHSARA
jgi:hypothetical protein